VDFNQVVAIRNEVASVASGRVNRPLSKEQTYNKHVCATYPRRQEGICSRVKAHNELASTVFANLCEPYFPLDGTPRKPLVADQVSYGSRRWESWVFCRLTMKGDLLVIVLEFSKHRLPLVHDLPPMSKSNIIEDLFCKS